MKIIVIALLCIFGGMFLYLMEGVYRNMKEKSFKDLKDELD